MIKYLKLQNKSMKKMLIPFVFGFLFIFVSNANAYWYQDLGTIHKAYYTDCGTGMGGLGNTTGCEPEPLFVPNDCYFPTEQNDLYSSVFMYWFGSFYGSNRQTAYQNIYYPDTNYLGSYAINENMDYFGKQYTLIPNQTNGTTITGYTIVLPSSQTQTALHNQLKANCWRTSLDILGNQNGGFETGNVSTSYDGKYHVPNWHFVNGTFKISNESIWLKTGNFYLNHTKRNEQFNDGLPANHTILEMNQPFYLPIELGGLYNISYDMYANFGWRLLFGDAERDIWVYTYIDSVLVNKTHLHWNLNEYQWTDNKTINGSFNYIVNLNSVLGSIHSLTIKVNGSCMGQIFRLNSTMYLDNVRLTSMCPNCTTYLDPSYAIIPITTTTTTIPSGSPWIDFSSISPTLAIINFLFTPFFIATCFMVGTSAYISSQVGGDKKMNSTIFAIIIIIFSLVFSYFGIYPSWLGIVFVIICSMFIANEFRQNRSG